METMSSNQRGFTIVELLIVIVVIAILAAISIVAYNGVQNRANDTAVKNDLRQFHSLIEQYKILNGNYPTTFTAAMGFKFAKNAYGMDAQLRNVRYCLNATTNEYIIYANSKSGNYFKYTTTGGLQDAAVTYGYGICSQIGLTSTNPSVNGYTDPSWAAWTN